MPIKAGDLLRFSFTAGNMAWLACVAEIEHWFGKDGEIQGNDTFYLEEHGSISESASLLLPASASGLKQFFLQMKCNDAVILASRKTEITTDVPVMPLFSSLVVSESGEGKQVCLIERVQRKRPAAKARKPHKSRLPASELFLLVSIPLFFSLLWLR